MARAIINKHRRADLATLAMDIARRVDAGEALPEADYVLNFENPVDAYRAVTPERFRLLQVLQDAGPLTVHALAQRLDRHYSNVHADVAALLDPGPAGTHRTRRSGPLGRRGVATEHGGRRRIMGSRRSTKLADSVTTPYSSVL